MDDGWCMWMGEGDDGGEEWGGCVREEGDESRREEVNRVREYKWEVKK